MKKTLFTVILVSTLAHNVVSVSRAHADVIPVPVPAPIYCADGSSPQVGRLGFQECRTCGPGPSMSRCADWERVGFSYRCDDLSGRRIYCAGPAPDVDAVSEEWVGGLIGAGCCCALLLFVGLAILLFVLARKRDPGEVTRPPDA